MGYTTRQLKFRACGHLAHNLSPIEIKLIKVLSKTLNNYYCNYRLYLWFVHYIEAVHILKSEICARAAYIESPAGLVSTIPLSEAVCIAGPFFDQGHTHLMNYQKLRAHAQ